MRPPKNGYIPYRDSKLTRLLKDSLGGSCKTVMIAAVSMSGMCYEDSHNTLKYAHRAKQIKTRVVQNVHNVKHHISHYNAIIADLHKEVADLKSKLADYRNRPSSARDDGPLQRKADALLAEKSRIVNDVAEGKGFSSVRVAEIDREISKISGEVLSGRQIMEENSAMSDRLFQCQLRERDDKGRKMRLALEKLLGLIKEQQSQLALCGKASHSYDKARRICGEFFAVPAEDSILPSISRPSTATADAAPFRPQPPSAPPTQAQAQRWAISTADRTERRPPSRPRTAAGPKGDSPRGEKSVAMFFSPPQHRVKTAPSSAGHAGRAGLKEVTYQRYIGS